MRSELALVVALVSSCAPDVVIGTERRLTVVATTPLADGRWRQAGFRVAETDTEPTSDLWYGTTSADGALPSFESPALADADAIRAATVLGTSWIVAGFVTEGGQRVAWLRALDETNAEVWTKTLPAPNGASTEVTAIATSNEGTLLVAGLEQDTRGWVAMLEPDGALRWRRSFETDFQGQTAGFTPLAIATEDGPPSPSRRQFWLSGRRALPAGETPGYVLQLTLDGDVWDSEPLGTSGSAARGLVAAGRNGIVVCTQTGDALQLAWTQGGAVSGPAVTDVPGAFELRTCLGSVSQVKLVGTLLRDGVRVPAVVTVDRASRAVVDTHETTPGPFVFGAAQAASGAVMLVGRTGSPLRRWSASLP